MKSSIHASSVLGDSVTLGENCVIEANVRIGKNCRIGHQVVIHADTVLGDDVRVDDHATLGKVPMKAANSALTTDAQLDPLEIGSHALIGTSAILYRGARVGSSVLVADQASIREMSSVGEQTIIGRGVTVENRVVIGKRCKIEAGVYVAGLSTIGDDCFVAPEVTITNDNYLGRTEARKKQFRGITIESGGRVGANATLLPGRRIEADGVAAAGSVVTRDVPASEIVAGVPAKPFRPVPREQLLPHHLMEIAARANGASRKEEPSRIPLLDLTAQYASLKEDIREALEGVLESQYFIQGPVVQGFEQQVADYVGSKHGIGVASGSDALLIALMALEIGPGDEVITTPYSFFATAGVVSRLGARPVFVDIDPLTYNLDVDQVEAAITPKTKALIPVHLYGLGARMDRVMEIADAYDLKVVEDAAQALSGEMPINDSIDDSWKKLGTIGHLGCYSFFPSKNLGAFGDGGMIVTDDDDLADRARSLRVWGSKPKYFHSRIGCNSRLDALQAAVLSVKLPHLEGWSRQRIANAENYDRMLAERCLVSRGIIRVPQRPYSGPGRLDHVYNQYVVQAVERDALKAHLTDVGIATEIYYPLPLHLQECYLPLGYQKGDFPESERSAESTLAIPNFPELNSDQQTRVVDSIADFYDKKV